MTGDGWRDAHDHVSDVLFDIAFHSGIRGSVEPRGIFSQAVPAEVLARAIDDEAEASAGRRSKPGAYQMHSSRLEDGDSSTTLR